MKPMTVHGPAREPSLSGRSVHFSLNWSSTSRAVMMEISGDQCPH